MDFLRGSSLISLEVGGGVECLLKLGEILDEFVN